jgi:hypothetical protein
MHLRMEPETANSVSASYRKKDQTTSEIPKAQRVLGESTLGACPPYIRSGVTDKAINQSDR